ncbi:MAG: NAD-dependent epimerase/dehydratase family protein [Deltaproteobacteria bacterium]|nr:NAD-dependent epimerase/dehydratase family protein [Deltaproteobacteria bacterium]
MSVIVTGATGLVGTGLIKILIERGETEIIAFHRNPGKKNLDELKDRITLLQGDLGIFSHVLEAVAKSRPKIIYHLGAMLTAPAEADPPAAFQANILGTFNVLESARLFDVEQVIFASSFGSYGQDIHADTVDDYTIQRPGTIYGVGKVFGENLGRYYRKRYAMDFRCIRYPGVLGPGFRTASMAQPFSRMIEESVMGRPYILRMSPDVRHPLLYFKDAALALIKLSEAPRTDIKTVCYLINGMDPAPRVREIDSMVRARIPSAALNFDPDPELTQRYNSLPRLDDHTAREEWGWRPEYNLEQSVDDFIKELRDNPNLYK